MKKISLLISLCLTAIAVFIGCHKDSLDLGNVGMLNLKLQRGFKSMNKGAVESFDARVTIYYSEDDTISYNCRFIDTDGDGLYINDPNELECIYARREVGFWVEVQAVVQGDTVTGMTDPTALLYLSEENPVIDVTIVLEAGYPRIVVSTKTEVAGEDILIFGEVLEGSEMLEEYAFAIRRGQLGDEEKRIWAKRFLNESDMQELFSYADYEFYEAEIFDNETNRFGCALEMMDFDSVEYSVAAIALMRMNDGDSIQNVIHSPVVSMKISDGGAIIEESVYIDEPYYDDSSVTLYGYYAGSLHVNECGFVLGFSEYELTDSMPCRQTDAIFSLTLSDLQTNTTYYYRAYVKTDDGTIESEIGQFQIMGMIQEFAVYTQDPYNVTASWATLSGYVTSTDGVESCGFILNMGTYNDTLTVESFDGGNFSYQLTNLTPSTTYSCQAFAIRGGWVFGEEVSFFTTDLVYHPTGGFNGHGYVDLGLPSGLMWAYTNIGADESAPYDYGSYYAWGETETKETYDWSTYHYCNGSEMTLTKYCNDGSYGNEGYTDELTTLEAEDDAATTNWGDGWRMPTIDDFQELVDNCDTAWITLNGVNGMLLTSRNNGLFIFLPAAGIRNGSELTDAGSYGYYWSSSLRTDFSYEAWKLNFNSVDFIMYDNDRYYGLSVRPVCVPSKKKK
ncbi:MAG: hypothetical protein J6W06_03865 [Bacteroidales bacterium]|nr:hypothetical protein [Bacteroidales bacterium]